MSEKPKYVEIKPQTRADLQQKLGSSDPNAVCGALYSAAQHDTDWRWSQNQCLRMLSHDSLLVRSAALIALGEIALFRGQLDVDIVLPQIRQFKSDPALAPFAEDALDNIRVAVMRSE